MLPSPEERSSLALLRRVAFRASHRDAEIARGRLLDVAPEGFEELELEGEVEFAVYTDRRGEALVASVFEGVSSAPVEAGWEERWRSFHRAVVAGGLWIGPPWESPPAGMPTVIIDPGQAFGTGAHPTTQACIGLLAAQRPGTVLDAGCGSGVVAVAAARLGAHSVVAVDVDPLAVEATRENARQNGVLVDARLLDVLADELPPCELVVANIELAIVERLLRRVPGRLAITSGYLAGEAPAVPRWRAREQLELGGWAAHLLEAL